MTRKREMCGALALGTLLFVAVWVLSSGVAQACHVKFGQNLKLIPTLTGGEKMENGVITPNFTSSNEITIVASDHNVQICPSGAATPMWTLGGDVPPPIVRRTTNPDGNNQGATKLTFISNLLEITQNQGNGGNVQGLGGGTQTGVPGNHSEISIHHHGSHVAPVGDGWACGYYIRSTNDGSSTVATDRTYDFFLRENDAANTTGGERGTTEWYHNHRVDVTGHTAWRGLAGGLFIIDDPADPQLPKGPAVVEGGVNKGFKYDVGLVIRDLKFNSNTNHNAPYTFDPQGSTGDHILVNGIPQPKFAVEPTKYLFRILVPGNARKYFMRLRRTNSNTNINMVQVMQDAGIVGPVNRTVIPIGIAERVGIVIDFAPHAGRSLILQNVQNTNQGGDCVPGNCTSATSEIMRFDVGTTVTQQENVNVNAIRRNVPNNNRNSPFYIGNSNANRAFRFTSEGQPFWTIVREDKDEADTIMDCRRYDADPTVNDVEQWTLHGVGNWTHSIHIHDVDQICVSRNGSSCPASDLFKEVWPMAPGVTFVVKLQPTDFTQASANAGNNDACTTSSSPPNNVASTSGNCSNTSFGTTGSNETIPTDSPDYHGTPRPDVAGAIDGETAGGRYMMHCHVLEHEDTAMMTQWRVKSVSNGGNTRNDAPCSTPGGCSP